MQLLLAIGTISHSVGAHSEALNLHEDGSRAAARQWWFYVAVGDGCSYTPDFVFTPPVWHATEIVTKNNGSFKLIILCCRG